MTTPAGLQYAKGLLDAHRRLERHLPVGLFADPALMILLDLLVARDRELSVGACCLAAGVPHTTALRWLRTLERQRLIERHPHPRDARSSMISLSVRARAALGAWIEEQLGRARRAAGQSEGHVTETTDVPLQARHLDPI